MSLRSGFYWPSGPQWGNTTTQNLTNTRPYIIIRPIFLIVGASLLVRSSRESALYVVCCRNCFWPSRYRTLPPWLSQEFKATLLVNAPDMQKRRPRSCRWRVCDVMALWLFLAAAVHFWTSSRSTRAGMRPTALQGGGGHEWRHSESQLSTARPLWRLTLPYSPAMPEERRSAGKTEAKSKVS